MQYRRDKLDDSAPKHAAKRETASCTCCHCSLVAPPPCIYGCFRYSSCPSYTFLVVLRPWKGAAAAVVGDDATRGGDAAKAAMSAGAILRASEARDRHAHYSELWFVKGEEWRLLG